MAPRQKISIPELFRLWHSGVKIADICEQLKVSDSHLRRLVQQHKLPRRPGGNTKRTQGIDPTPSELEELMLETRQKWSAKEADSRYVGPRPTPWHVPTYYFDGGAGGFNFRD